jgi:hypothetical protein
LCLSIPLFPEVLQAYGNNLAATIVLAGGLVWHILHPLPEDALSPALSADLSRPSGGLKADMKAQP